MLCTECQLICAGDPEEDQSPWHDGKKFMTFEPVQPFKPTLRALKQSALDGCRVCRYLQQLLENDQRYKIRVLEELNELPVRFSWWATDDYYEGGGFVHIERPKSVGGKDDPAPQFDTLVGFFVELSTDRANTNTIWSQNRNIEINPLSQNAVLLMKRWLHSCLEDHPECVREACYRHSLCGTSPIPKLPTRVLDVGLDKFNPRLINSADLRGSYAALSHCWGKGTRTTTTQASLERMMEGIPLSEFSPTFHDAIVVCRHLEIPYLWIDSICIIQDDTEDWIREASNMAEIYKNSRITLAAACITNSQQSFIQERPALFAGCELNESLGGLFLRPKTKGWREEVDLTVYNSRAWCYQEQQLSPRILYFCDEELIWYCKHAWQREASSGNIFPGFEHNAHLFEKWKNAPKTRIQVEATDWYKIIIPYTMKKMSFPEDKLPALSGIAAEVQRATGSEYLAGIWKDSLISGLMWTRLYTSKIGNKFFTRAKVDSAPSWSWASYDGIITYHSDLFEVDPEIRSWTYSENNFSSKPKDLVTILDAQTTLFDESYPLGRVTGGKLTVRGPCRDFSYSQYIRDKEGENSAIITNAFLPDNLPTSVFDLDPSQSWKDDNQLTCMLFRMMKPQARLAYTDERPFAIFGLILRLVDKQNDVYQRVGCGMGRTHPDSKEFKDWMTRTVQIV